MTAFAVLLVDDDALFGETVQSYLARDGIEVAVALDLASARAALEVPRPLVVLDALLPDGAGASLIPLVRQKAEEARIIMVTGSPAIEDAVEAIRAGIDDYLEKPIDLEALRLAVLRTRRAFETSRVAAIERRRREQSVDASISISGEWFERQRDLFVRGAESSHPLLLLGETGTGKTLLATKAHQLSPRSGGPFLSLNCATLPAELVESELFGHDKGAFTGATSTREGLFELADGGTLFLDEVGELPLPAQAKLLSVLEDGVIRRVGGSSLRKVDVRIIAATHQNLKEMCAARRFRDDLRYRIEVIVVTVAPLRERTAEIEPIVETWLRASPGRHGTVPSLAPGELAKLLAYPWPGNVRELKNVIDRALLLRQGSVILPSAALPSVISPAQSPSRLPKLCLADLERQRICEALEDHGSSRIKTAESLGISLATLRRKLNELSNGSHEPS